MFKKIILTIFGFYLLTLLQASFFIHFSSYVPNLILIAVVLVNFFEKQKHGFGIFSALVGGFFLDVFFGPYIGYYILICFLTSLFIKLVLKKYVG
ncbi:MAG: hypothetical protein KJI70_03210 [Patescibacteria group bacterium]|nr:hypothetical protein [Patescibacteria group bacterium]